MTQTPIKLSFEEYLTYDDGTDNRYELVDGELTKMPPPTGKHESIIFALLIWLHSEIQRLGINWVPRPSGIEVKLKTSRPNTRRPDICVITEEQRQEIETTSAILHSPPLLIVEVVSPESTKRDYQEKPSEYAAIKVPEYWIVDPILNKVSVLLLVDNTYEVREFRGNQRIVSHTFPELTLASEQVLSA